MKKEQKVVHNTKQRLVAIIIAIAAGILIGILDSLIIKSDDGSKITMLLLFVAGAGSTLVYFKSPFLIALACGVWLCVVHLILSIAGVHDTITPDTLTSRLLLLPVGIVVAGAGAYCVYFIRRISGQ